MEYYILLMQYQTFYIKTYEHFIVPGDINFPYRHSFAALNIFVWFTVTFSLTIHINTVVFPLQQWLFDSAKALHYTFVTYLFP